MEKVNVWKANLTNGLIMGLVGIVFTLVVYFFDLTFNKANTYIFLAISAVLLYFLIISYRNNHLHGYITYGQSVGAGVIIFLYYSIISSIFMYLLYKVIDPGLTEKMLAFIEEQMLKKGIPEANMESIMAMQKKIMKPEIMSVIGIFNNMVFGTVISLLVSIFTRKEGNPIVDSSTL